MKRILTVVLILAGFFGPAVLHAQAGNETSEIKKYIMDSQLMVFAPAYETLITNVKSLLARFYGKNYDQMMVQISSNSRSSYGIDILNLESMKSAGINIAKPVAFVHISNQAGYMLIPIQSKKTVESYIRTHLGKNKAYRIAGNYLIFSENAQILASVPTNNRRLETNPAFTVASTKLDFKWDKIFAWIESRYFSVVTSSVGVSANMNIPYGFTAFTADFFDKQISIRNYSGILSSNQTEYVRKLRDVSAAQKFELLDYISGNPAVIGDVYMNMPMLYKYYSYIDTINILGVKGFINELMDKYRINVERDLLNNSDGRLKVVVDQFDPEKNTFLVYGSMGIKSPEVAISFMDSVKNSVLQSTNGTVTTFDLFTKPFYHYQSSNYSLYYGVIDNDFVFSADRDVLTNMVKNLFENRSGFLDSAPPLLKEFSSENRVGYFITVDVQSLFSKIKTGIMISREFLVGIKEINIYGNPDTDDKPYGWNTTIDINFYN